MADGPAVNVQQRIDETAFAMLGLPPEQREELFIEAFAVTLAKNPRLTEVPPAIVAFTAAVIARVAELERQVGTA
jgi:hypothetical protein